MTTVDRLVAARSGTQEARVVAAAAFALPPLILVTVGVGLAFRGGGVAPEQWQPAAVGVAASLLVLGVVGAVPAIPKAAWPALAFFTALLLWTGLSLVWSQSREATFEQTVRFAMLGLAAFVGVAYAARPRAALALAAGLAVAGSVVAAATELKLLSGDTSVLAGSRLSWPIDYANGTAALVWMTVPPLVAFAAAQPLRPFVRALAGMFASLALAIGLTTLSRGGMIAISGALIACIVIARDRARFTFTLLAVAAPVIAVATRLTGTDAASATATAHLRADAALFSAVGGTVLVGAFAMLDRRRRPPFGRYENRIAFVTCAALLAVGVGLFVVKVGRPDSWVSARWSEFRHVTPTQGSDAARFGTATGNRYDYWRVAAHATAAHPVGGVGAGAFAVPWFRSRSVDESVTDAHSWEAGALAELGLVGFALTAGALLLPLFGVRSARRGEGAWPIAALALGGTAVYFVLHASVDWLFRIPAVAIPGFVVLGCLATGGKAGELRSPTRGGRGVVTAVGLGALVLAVPAYISTAAITRAETQAATSTNQAVRTTRLAARANPFSVEPLIVRSAILGLEGRRSAAAAAAKTGTAREPNSWVAWLTLAETERAAGRLVSAREAFRRAVALNPRTPQVAYFSR